jgi:hypothetical protein
MESGLDYTFNTGDSLIFEPRRDIWTTEGTIDPTNNRFVRNHVRPESSPGITRSNHHLVRLADGRVLLIGGYASGPGTPEDERAFGGSRILIYDPQHASWTYAGDLGARQALHTTTLLPDGTVLVIGGVATRWFGPTDPQEVNRESAYDTYRHWRTAADGAVLRYRPPPP